MTVRITISEDNFYLDTVTKQINADKEIVKATKSDCYFNRYECSLYRNKARLSVSHICYSVTVIFLRIYIKIFFFTFKVRGASYSNYLIYAEVYR